jgi:hypothetical protein
MTPKKEKNMISTNHSPTSRFYDYFKEIKGSFRKTIEDAARTSINKLFTNAENKELSEYIKTLDNAMNNECNCELITHALSFQQLVETLTESKILQQNFYITLLWYIALHEKNRNYKLVPYLARIKISSHLVEAWAYQLIDEDIPILSFINDDTWYIVEEFDRVKNGCDVATPMLFDTALPDAFNEL